MEPTAAKRPRPERTKEAAATKLPIAIAIFAAILCGFATSPTRADCNPAGRIDARCYPNLQDATAAAIAANEPLWLPAGSYTLDRELVIDYAPLAATGFQIISDGAVIDARATGQRAVSVECGGGTPDDPKGCFYFASRVPFRPKRFLGRAQFGENRPPDRQQLGIGICD